MSEEELKMIHDLESQNYVEADLTKEEKEFRKNYLEEQMSL